VFVRVNDGSQTKRKEEGSACKGVATPGRGRGSRGTRGTSKGKRRGVGPVTRREREKRGRRRRPLDRGSHVTRRIRTRRQDAEEKGERYAALPRRRSRLPLRGRSPTPPPFRVAPLAAVRTCSRTPSPTPVPRPRSRGSSTREEDTPPTPSPRVDTRISPSKGRRLPPLRGGSTLSPTPGQGPAGPRPPSAH
jgi:hypothetical protein